MSNENIHESYDKAKWIYIPDKDTDYRCVLGTVGEKPLFVVGINLSTAKSGELEFSIYVILKEISLKDDFYETFTYIEKCSGPNEN